MSLSILNFPKKRERMPGNERERKNGHNERCWGQASWLIFVTGAELSQC